MSKTCDRCGKKLNERDRTTICLECEVALADEVNEELEAENERLKHNTDAIWDIYQSSKRENAALREKTGMNGVMKQPKVIIKKANMQKLDYLDKREIKFIENHIGVPLSVGSLWWDKSDKLAHVTVQNGNDVITLFTEDVEYEFLMGGE